MAWAWRRCFPALLAEGCRTAFVATLGEAQALRGISPAPAIYALNGLLPGTAPLFEEAGARPVLSSLDEVAEWAAYCKARGLAAARRHPYRHRHVAARPAGGADAPARANA